MEGLVQKPQFDNTVFKVGFPVQLAKKLIGTRGSSGTVSSRQWDKFSSGDYGLIKLVEPLAITILLVDGKELTLSVDAIANGDVKITRLGCV